MNLNTTISLYKCKTSFLSLIYPQLKASSSKQQKQAASVSKTTSSIKQSAAATTTSSKASQQRAAATGRDDSSRPHLAVRGSKFRTASMAVSGRGRSRRGPRLRVRGPEETRTTRSPSRPLELLGEEDDRGGVATAPTEPRKATLVQDVPARRSQESPLKGRQEQQSS